MKVLLDARDAKQQIRQFGKGDDAVALGDHTVVVLLLGGDDDGAFGDGHVPRVDDFHLVAFTLGHAGEAVARIADGQVEVPFLGHLFA